MKYYQDLILILDIETEEAVTLDNMVDWDYAIQMGPSSLLCRLPNNTNDDHKDNDDDERQRRRRRSLLNRILLFCEDHHYQLASIGCCFCCRNGMGTRLSFFLGSHCCSFSILMSSLTAGKDVVHGTGEDLFVDNKALAAHFLVDMVAVQWLCY